MLTSLDGARHTFDGDEVGICCGAAGDDQEVAVFNDLVRVAFDKTTTFGINQIEDMRHLGWCKAVDAEHFVGNRLQALQFLQLQHW